MALCVGQSTSRCRLVLVDVQAISGVESLLLELHLIDIKSLLGAGRTALAFSHLAGCTKRCTTIRDAGELGLEYTPLI